MSDRSLSLNVNAYNEVLSETLANEVNLQIWVNELYLDCNLVF